MRTKLVAALGAASLAGAALAAPTFAAPAGNGATTTNGCVTSVPEQDTTTPVKICYSLFKPAGADAGHRVPLIFHSHGWGGSRTTTASSFDKFLKAGFGVLSFDQRGWGESGGKARVENPDYEGRDVEKLVALVSKLSWVQQDGPGDPRLGAIGGSYGGGYQFVGAFREIRDKGKPVFDALAPEITWWDLKQTLAPADVARGEWISLLTAAGAQALPTDVLTATAYGAATGLWPDGTVPGIANMNQFFEKNGPAWNVKQGRVLDIPVLFGQGITDTLFPLYQGLQNWTKALTPHARANSIFVGYNGGHVLPNAFPYTPAVSGDPCSKQLAGGDFSDLTLRFFTEKLKHHRTGLGGYGRLHLATASNTCTTVTSAQANKAFKVGTVATSETAGVPVGFKVADGPIRIAGTPYLEGTMFAAGVNNRAFYGLGVGLTPADAQLVQGNVLPVNELLPVAGEKRSIELPSVAVNVPKGQSLFVLAMPFSDAFPGFGSRTPGAIVLQDAVVRLPVVGN
ncbi:MAG: type transport system ATP-binding protein [Frankiaceae bacterium]|jgi:pimeloyl-ACP methyl ester carboxylesterase|nr:type transport system ATP-binding protein [Frankiaceae bacterium]